MLVAGLPMKSAHGCKPIICLAVISAHAIISTQQNSKQGHLGQLSKPQQSLKAVFSVTTANLVASFSSGTTGKPMPLVSVTA